MGYFNQEIECDECGGRNIFIVKPDDIKEKDTVKMSELRGTISVPLVYKMTTYQCKDCGYSVSF